MTKLSCMCLKKGTDRQCDDCCDDYEGNILWGKRGEVDEGCRYCPDLDSDDDFQHDFQPLPQIRRP